jgi:hypothetical protein
MFEASFNAAVDRYQESLRQVDADRLQLANDNFDVGEVTPPGVYRMNDDTHAKLLDRLAAQKFAGTTPEIRAELLSFYGDPNAPYATKRNRKEWSKVEVQLQQLKTAAAAPPTAQTLPAF